MNYQKIQVNTRGEKFYDITTQVRKCLDQILQSSPSHSGILHLFIKHTSAALTINEAFDPSAAVDMQEFLKHLATPNLSFITHTTEGPDDSPSHMKSILLNNSLTIFIENKKLLLGQWQGIYLAEFRQSAHQREILIKFQSDPI